MCVSLQDAQADQAGGGAPLRGPDRVLRPRHGRRRGPPRPAGPILLQPVWGGKQALTSPPSYPLVTALPSEVLSSFPQYQPPDPV